MSTRTRPRARTRVAALLITAAVVVVAGFGTAFVAETEPRAAVDLGSSPITGAAIHLACDEVTGSIYSADAAGPACKITDDTLLTGAVGDLEIAYRDDVFIFQVSGDIKQASKFLPVPHPGRAETAHLRQPAPN